MFLDDLAGRAFSLLCHQDPARTFAPGGEPLSLCARCVGVYVGIVLALPLMIVAARLPRKLSMYLHGAFVLQVIPFGFNLIPHGITLRAISGQLFAIGVVYFLSRGVRPASPAHRPGRYPLRWLIRYALVVAQAVILLQLFLRLPWPWAATVLNGLALLGLGIFVVLAVLFMIKLGGHVLRRRAA